MAITRAKKRLVLTNAVMRRSFGDFVENPPSRFLDEIPRELLHYTESSPWTGVQTDPLRAGLGVAGDRMPEGFMPRSADRFSRPGAPARRAPAPPRPAAPSWDANPHGDDFAVGRIVTHPMFGRGQILHKEGSGDSLKLTIRFQDSGTKKILPRHTTLVVHD